MIQRQHLQRSIFEAAIGSIEKLIDGLIEPALQRLDEVLADEQLLEAVLGRLAQRWSQSRTRGRPTSPTWCSCVSTTTISSIRDSGACQVTRTANSHSSARAAGP